MPKVPYNKPVLNHDQQLQQLINRGMIINDPAEARHYLAHLNYYRLGAYWLPFEADHASHRFKPNTRFERILDHYIFDRELRLMVMDAIERIEVAIRAQFAYQLGHRYGSHPHLDPQLFKAPNRGWDYSINRQKLQDEISQSKEAFIQHLLAKYAEPMPPVWALVEVMTLGQLSKWYANLKHGADRNLIAHVYDFDEVNLTSFLHHLSTVRNLCAHHSRLWNREFTFTFKIPWQRPQALTLEFVRNPPHTRKIYNTLLMMAWFLDIVSPGHHWKQRLKALIEKYKIDVSAMSFPANWLESSVWATK